MRKLLVGLIGIVAVVLLLTLITGYWVNEQRPPFHPEEKGLKLAEEFRTAEEKFSGKMISVKWVTLTQTGYSLHTAFKDGRITPVISTDQGVVHSMRLPQGYAFLYPHDLSTDGSTVIATAINTQKGTPTLSKRPRRHPFSGLFLNRDIRVPMVYSYQGVKADIKELPPLYPDGRSQAVGMNEAGNLYCGWAQDENERILACTWNSSGELTIIHPSDNQGDSLARDVEKNIVVGAHSPAKSGKREACWWIDGKFSVLPTPDCVESLASAVGQDGTIVGWMKKTENSPPIALLWKDGSCYLLTEMLGDNSSATWQDGSIPVRIWPDGSIILIDSEKVAGKKDLPYTRLVPKPKFF